MLKRFQTAYFACAFGLFASASAVAGSSGWIATGPFGGNAEAIAASDSNPNLLIAGSKNCNLYVSRDAGAHWQSMTFPRQYQAMLHTLVIDPSSETTFYAAIADEPGPGLYKTVDSGKTWRPIFNLPKGEVYSLAFFNGDSKVMAAGLRERAWITKDGGASWNPLTPADNIELRPVVSVAFDPADANVVYAGTPRLPWKSTDGGATWNLMAEGMSTDSDIITVRVDAKKPSRVFIGACSGFWRSNNGGELWAKFAGIPFTSRRTYAFVQDRDHPDRIFAGTSRGLYRTRDGGLTWKEIASHEIKSLAISAGVLYVATADAGIFKSADEGSTLEPIDVGFVSRNFAHLSENGEQIYTGTGSEVDAGNIFSSSDGGLHWTQIGDSRQIGNESVISVTRANPGVLLAATQSGLYRSADSGKSWIRLKNPMGGAHISDFDSRNGHLIAATDAGLFQSKDDGETWSAVPGVHEPVKSFIPTHVTVAVTAQSLWVENEDGRWSRRHLPFFAEIFDVAGAGDTILAGTSRGAFHSEDGGQTWRAAEAGLPAASVTSVSVDSQNPMLAFAFEYGNLYESTDAGKNWHHYDQEGLGGAYIRSFSITSLGAHRLLAVTATRGIFVRDIDEGNSPKSSFSAVELRKERYVPNQQNEKAPVF